MKRDPVFAAATEVCDSWEREAQQRKQRTPSDPVAEALATCASEMKARLEAIERDTAYLTVDQYAAVTSASASTVRRLCARGLIDGAERDLHNDWRIPRGAKRLARAKSDVELAS